MRKKRVEHDWKSLTPIQKRVLKANEQTIQHYLASRNLRPETKHGIRSTLNLLNHFVCKPFREMNGKDINAWLETLRQCRDAEVSPCAC